VSHSPKDERMDSLPHPGGSDMGRPTPVDAFADQIDALSRAALTPMNEDVMPPSFLVFQLAQHLGDANAEVERLREALERIEHGRPMEAQQGQEYAASTLRAIARVALDV